MYKEISNRKKIIFTLVLMFHACGLFFISYVNDWFGIKTHYLQEEKIKLKDKEIKNERKIREKKVKNNTKDQRLLTNRIYLPKQKAFKKQEEKIIENVNKQPERSIAKKIKSTPKEHSLPEKVEKAEDIASVKTVNPVRKSHEELNHHLKKKNDYLVDSQRLISDQSNGVKSTEKKQNSIAHKKEPEFTSKKVSLPEKTAKKFNFTEYKKNLIENYELREGENIPLLLIDDHGKSGLYKTGLEFYGYQLIARPKVPPKEPYYFVINNSVMKRIDEICPYSGDLPSVIQEDYKLFKRLLSQPQFAEMSNMEYELFYASLDTSMLKILACKQKFIIESRRLDAGDISKMVGTFKRVGISYILIIEAIVTIDGRYMKVNDQTIEL